MIRLLFRMYRASPFFLRNFLGQLARILGLALRPFSVIRVGNYRMALDFSDNASFKYASDRAQYESLEIRAFLEAIRSTPDSTVVDLGANYGAYTLAAGNLAKQLGHTTIISIEPDRRPFTALSRSVQLNRLESVCRLFQMIAGDKEGIETLWVNARSSADNRTHSVLTSKIRVRESYTVRSTSIDTLFEEEGIPIDRPLIVKMDIQGNEPRAFYGMANVLAKAPTWLILFEHAPYLIESAGLDVGTFVDYLKHLNVEHAFAVSNDGEFTDLENFDGLAKAMLNVGPVRGYNGEAPVMDIVISRGVDDDLIDSIKRLHS